ncbi:MAG: metal-dependent hydrolase, partial [Methanomicrobiales archaeon]|nr:metal-dependent hydrolase [Methanomicrobiales archaeon]
PLFASIPLSTWAIVYTGILIGSLAPDADAPDAAIFHLYGIPRGLRTLLALFGYLLRYLVYLPLSSFFWIALGRNYRHEHRGLLHTPLGITLASLILVFYAGIPSLVFFHSFVLEILLWGGCFWGGCLLHLVQDSCTLAGIAWSFPLSVRRLRGGLRTGDMHDPRPLLFVSILGGCLLLLILLPAHLLFPPWLLALFLIICVWLLFLFLSRLEYRPS